MSFKSNHIYCSIIAIIFAFISCTETPKFETCGGQPTCPPPTDEKASDNIKKMRQDIAGKWKFASLTSRDTAHKTEQNYNALRASMCVSYDGGIQFLRDYTELVCVYCYELQSANDTINIKLDETGLSKYCKEQFQSGAIVIRNDSMIVARRDSFIVKSIIYKRMNDDGTFKVSK